MLPVTKLSIINYQVIAIILWSIGGAVTITANIAALLDPQNKTGKNYNGLKCRNGLMLIRLLGNHLDSGSDPLLGIVNMSLLLAALGRPMSCELIRPVVFNQDSEES